MKKLVTQEKERKKGLLFFQFFDPLLYSFDLLLKTITIFPQQRNPFLLGQEVSYSVNSYSTASVPHSITSMYSIIGHTIYSKRMYLYISDIQYDVYARTRW